MEPVKGPEMAVILGVISKPLAQTINPVCGPTAIKFDSQSSKLIVENQI